MKNISLIILAVLVLLAACISIIAWRCFYAEAPGDLGGPTKLYDSFLRQSLFTGFLTLGGFLLSMKTFILVNVKKDVYDSDAYTKFLKDCEGNGIQVERYTALYELQRGLTLSIVLCLLASASQFTFGLLSYWWAKATATSLAAFALGFVLWAVWLLYANTKTWIDYAAKDKKAKPESGGPKQG